MRVVIAPDKFKGSLTAPEAAGAMARGVRRVDRRVRVDQVPMADGGEGTVDALVAATGGSLREVAVTGPLGEPGGRLVRPARRRPHGGDRDGLGLGPGPGPTRIDATPGAPPRGAPASCSWPPSTPAPAG